MAEAAPDNVYIDDIILPAVDGFALAGTLFLARGRKTHAVLISSDIGVPREAYRSFAAYLASRGCAVLTYDYRGIGGSLPLLPGSREKSRTLKGFSASLTDWAARDATAAVAWMRGRYQDIPLSYVGHGFGGQAFGLIPNNADVSRALLVGTSAAYWKTLESPARFRVLARIKSGALLTKLLGYVPAWLAGGSNLPKGVFAQWARWSDSENSLFDDRSLPLLGNFANYTGALRSISFTDDIAAKPAAVGLLARHFTATRPQFLTLAPADLGVARVGHLGFFKGELRDTLWRGSAEWLETETQPQRSQLAAARA